MTSVWSLSRRKCMCLKWEIHSLINFQQKIKFISSNKRILFNTYTTEQQKLWTVVTWHSFELLGHCHGKQPCSRIRMSGICPNHIGVLKKSSIHFLFEVTWVFEIMCGIIRIKTLWYTSKPVAKNRASETSRVKRMPLNFFDWDWPVNNNQRLIIWIATI